MRNGDDHSSSGRTAVLFTTHVINAQVKAHFTKLRNELPADYELFLFYDERRLKQRAVRRLGGDRVLPHDESGWKQFKRPGRYFKEKIPGNEDGLLMNAMARLPDYSWYWYIEYDMAFSGDWRVLFDAMADCTADILAVNITRHRLIPDWPLWKSIEVPAGSELPDVDRIRVHLAISRFSHRVNEVLVPVYSKGWAGHAEALFCSLAAANGLEVEDIGGDSEFAKPDNVNRFYRSTRTSNSLGPGTLVFRPPMHTVGREPNMLWHPVKKASRNDWDSEGGWFARLVTRIRHNLAGRGLPG